MCLKFIDCVGSLIKWVIIYLQQKYISFKICCPYHIQLVVLSLRYFLHLAQPLAAAMLTGQSQCITLYLVVLNIMFHSVVIDLEKNFLNRTTNKECQVLHM